MAVAATTVWEMRTTGAATNGGGFNASRDAVNGVDYSQQDAAQLALTDIVVHNGDNTIVHSTTGGFTHAMEGNVIYISGEGYTTGWYEITTYTDGNTVTIDRNPLSAAADASGGTGNVGGALYIVNGTTLGTWHGQIAAGNTIHVKAGTYTLTTANVDVGTAGTSALPIVWYGYNTTRGDAPSGTNRPLFSCGAYAVIFAVYEDLNHLSFSGTANNMISWSVTSYARVYNCRFESTSASDNRAACRNSGGNRYVACEFKSRAGYGISYMGAENIFIGCWFRECFISGSHHASNGGVRFVACLFTDCGAGINVMTGSGINVLNCTFVNCGTGILSSSTGAAFTIWNNIFAYCTKGLDWSGGTNYLSNWLEYNDFYGNGTDVTNVNKGSTDDAYDPAFQGLVSWTDLVMDASNNKVFTSVTGGFDTYFEIGSVIWLDAATSWTSGVYRVTDVSSTSMTLATSPAAVNTTGGKLRTIKTAVNAADCRLGTSSSCRGAGYGLSIGVGS